MVVGDVCKCKLEFWMKISFVENLLFDFALLSEHKSSPTTRINERWKFGPRCRRLIYQVPLGTPRRFLSIISLEKNRPSVMNFYYYSFFLFGKTTELSPSFRFLLQRKKSFLHIINFNFDRIVRRKSVGESWNKKKI